MPADLRPSSLAPVTDSRWRPRWAVSTLGDPAANLDDWMRLCTEWNIAEIELRSLSGSLGLPSTLSAAYGSTEAWSTWLRDQPAVIAVLSASLRLADNNPAHRDELLALVPWAEAAGIRWFRVFDQVGPYRPWTDAEWGNAVTQFLWWREQRARHGWRVDLLIETHHILYSPKNYDRFCELVGERPPLVFDLGHAVRGLGPDAALDAWRVLAPHCPRVHFKDLSPPAPDATRHCLPGTGTAPLDAFWRAFKQTSPAPVVTLEWERHWEPRLPPLTDALAALRDRHWL